MPSNSIWVVTTDSSTCRIYNYSKHPAQLSLHKELYNPESRLRDVDLTSDKPGRYATTTGAHGSFSQATDPKEIKIDHFTREIADELNHGRTNQLYEKLILIAAPRMNGLLKQHLNKHVDELITHNIEKDLIHLPEHALIDFLKEHTQYPGKI